MFLKASFHRPHSPYDPPKRLYDKYMGLDYDDTLLARNINKGSWDDTFYVDNENGTTMQKEAWHGDPGVAAARASRAAYLASVEFVDEGIGSVLDWIDDAGLLDDFLIIWVADHGDMQGDHNLWRKGYPWEESAHVPLVIKPPSSSSPPPPEKSEALVELRDIAPTIWDYAAILPTVLSADGMINGKSLRPILEAGEVAVRSFLDLEHNRVYNDTVHWNAVLSQDGGMKYIFNPYDGREQLFNVTADPGEARDLSLEPEWHGEVAKWRAQMVSQFEDEDRGEEWVKDGVLQLRVDGGISHSVNFPCFDDLRR